MASRTLLIVETPGNESGRYRELARRAGYTVETTNSGPMTPAAVKRTQPALVVLTPYIHSPGPSEIARTLKEDPEVADVPVLMLVPDERARSQAYPTEACVTLDVSDDELLRTMRLLAKNTRKVTYETRPSGPLEGELEDDTLPDVLQFLFATRKTGRVSIQDGSRRPGRIYIEQGNVVHAEYDERTGMEAFRKLCFAERGRFKFEPDARTPHRTMHEGGIEMLLEAARKKDTDDRDGADGTPGRQKVAARKRPQPSLSSLSATERPESKPRTLSGWLTRITRKFS